MTAPAIAFHELVSVGELRKLAEAAGPCITIATVLPNPREIRARVRNALHALERDFSSSTRGQNVTELLQPIRDAAETIELDVVWGKALLILRSPEIFQGYWLQGWQREILSAGERFQLRPLLAAISRVQRFYMLAISRGQVRLFDSTMYRAEEIKLPASTPDNLRDWLNERQPDHMLDNRSTGGPSTGSMKGVMFTTSTDREKRDEYLRHYFKEIDRGVHTVLRDDGTPMVLAGVQEELAAYRRVNSYPALLETEVHGSPDRMSVQELLEHARQVLSDSPSEPLRNVLGELRRRATSSDLKEIARMAPEGRIDNLLIAADAEDERLDQAAAETLRHGGQVFDVIPAEMPENARVMATLRH